MTAVDLDGGSTYFSSMFCHVSALPGMVVLVSQLSEGDGACLLCLLCSLVTEVAHTSFEAEMKEVAMLGVASTASGEAADVCPTSSEALTKPVTPSVGCECVYTHF